VNGLAEAVQRRVGERIRALRTGRGLTQVRLAERAGISRPSLANVEAGRQNIGVRRLCSLAAALGVRVEELLTGTDEPG
jgi:transcriptional regulator with XRE-family HTH domain